MKLIKFITIWILSLITLGSSVYLGAKGVSELCIGMIQSDILLTAVGLLLFLGSVVVLMTGFKTIVKVDCN